MNKYVTNLTLPNGTNLLIKDSECRTNLSNEINRATEKETELKNKIESETTRATEKETELKNKIEDTKASVLNEIKAWVNNNQHPIGSIYMSIKNTSPAELFGGTWEQLKDRFLLAAGDTYSAGSTGGEAQHKLTESEMPSHRHGILKGDPSSSTTGNPNQIQANPELNYAWANPKNDNKFYWESYTDFIGGSKPHNNMPPYMTVYMWKRIS